MSQETKIVRGAADEAEHRFSDPDRQTPEQIEADRELDRLTRSRMLVHQQRLGKKQTVLGVLADVFIDLDLTEDQIKARATRLFSEPGA